MGVLDFIFGVLVLGVIFIIALGGICMHYDTKKLEQENEELRNNLKKARERKIKREYKKASDIGGKK